jgi:predicted RNase H-like HicB family nuclease
MTPDRPLKGDRVQYDQFRKELRFKGSVKIKVIIHEAEEGGFWAEVPAIPGCATQGDTFEELSQNLYEAIEGCLSAIG